MNASPRWLTAAVLYARWELRDAEIASLHLPPPRADMRQYARELEVRRTQPSNGADVGPAPCQVHNSDDQLSVTEPTSRLCIYFLVATSNQAIWRE